MPSRGTFLAGAATAAAIIAGVGYCTGEFGLNESEEGRGVGSELEFSASELESTLGTAALTNYVELSVTHDLELGPREIDLYTDVFPATVPAFLEFKMEDLPAITVYDSETPDDLSDDIAEVTIDRGNVFVQERVEQLQGEVSFTVEDGVLVEGAGLPIEPGTPVGLEDGTYQTGKYEFDQEAAESILTKYTDAFTFGLTDINSGVSEHIAAIGQVAALNPACIEAIDDSVGLENMMALSFRGFLEGRGFSEDRQDVVFTGEWPEDYQFPDETGTTFDAYLETISGNLQGNNKKKIVFTPNCDADNALDSDSSVELAPAA